MERSYARAEERNREVRENLEPLTEGERPLVVTIGAAISALIALSIIGGYLFGAEVDGEKPPLAQVLAPTLLMGVMAWGMWRARYWAVLGMQTLLGLTIVASALALLTAVNAWAAILVTLLLLGSGTLFWFLVKAMARIQMPERPGSQRTG